MAVWRLQVNTGGANVADYCLQNHVAALGGWQGTCYGAFIKAILHVSDELIEKIYIDFFNRLPEFFRKPPMRRLPGGVSGIFRI